MKRIFTIIAAGLLLGWSSLNAQTVETVLDTSNFITDYLAVGPGGDVYHANRSSAIHKITPDGVTSIFATNSAFNFVTGMDFDSNGNLYVASSNFGSILKVSPDGTVNPFVDNLNDFPVGIDVDSQDNVYVALWFAGTAIKITQAGDVSTYATGIGEGAVDVVFDEAGNLYSANFLNGRIFATPPNGATTMIGSVNTVAGYMTYAGGHLYVTGYNSHYVYRVTTTGEVTIYSGTGVGGTLDGPVATAQFNKPNGISATASGDTIYISHDSGDRKLRRIVGINTTAIGDPVSAVPGVFELSQNFPNPFNPTTEIRYSLASPMTVSLEVIDVLGNRVVTLVDGFRTAGEHQVRFDGRDLASGIYIYRLSAGNASAARRMLLVR